MPGKHDPTLRNRNRIAKLERELKDARKALAGVQEIVVSLRAGVEQHEAAIRRFNAATDPTYADVLAGLSGKTYSD